MSSNKKQKQETSCLIKAVEKSIGVMKDYLGGRPTYSGMMVMSRRNYVPSEQLLPYQHVAQNFPVIDSLIGGLDDTESSKKLKSDYETLKSRCQELNERHQAFREKKEEADSALEHLMNYHGVFGFQDEVKRLAGMKRIPAQAQPILKFAYDNLSRATFWGDNKLKAELEAVEKQYPQFFAKYLRKETPKPNPDSKK